ncbi:carbohydrate ABC transporter permease [Radiobacillus sp. PE A8.2]|uniref:carbohydrate ABC transporter permease n=1 Tax=Radiobacillus sp. PE A8.2 TaxID=3380349 RepID=UPI00388DE191
MKVKPTTLWNFCFVTFLLLLTLFPFYLLIITSFKYQDQIINHFWIPIFPLHLENYLNAFMQIWRFILNSVVVTGGIIVGVIINSTMAGYAFSRFNFIGKNFMYYFIIMLMMVPGFLLLIPQFILFRDLGLINTYAAQILAPMAFGTALATMLTRTFFEEIPKSLLESAEMDGANELQIFAKIFIPMSKPIIATIAVVNAITGWNNYIWPLVVTSGDKVRPVILALNNISGPLNEVQGIEFAGYVIASIPILILFSFATRPFVAGLTSGALKG